MIRIEDEQDEYREKPRKKKPTRRAFGLSVLLFLGSVVLAGLTIVIHYTPGELWQFGIYAGRHEAVACAIASAALLLLSLWHVTFRCTRGAHRRSAVFAVLGPVLIISLGFASGGLIPLHSWEGGSQQRALARGDRGRFVVMSDSGHGPRNTANLVKQVAAMHDEDAFDAMLLVGDIVDGDQKYSKAFHGKVVLPFQPVIERGIPMFLALGNHEVYDGHAPHAVNEPIFNMEGEPYYKVTFGDGLVTVFALDSTRLLVTADQFLWLRDGLRADTSRWRVVLHHHPLLATREMAHGEDRRRYIALRTAIEGESGIDLFLSGHNHVYERRHPHNGVLHVTSGNASSTSRVKVDPFPRDSGRAFIKPGVLGFVTLDVTAERLELRAHRTNGEVFDSYTLEKPL